MVFSSNEVCVPTFVYELAHQCRDALSKKSVRKRVRQTVYDTLKAQDSLLHSDSEAIVLAEQKHLAWAKGGGVGDEPPWPWSNRNQGLSTRTRGWPFPVEHGTDDAPGCILVLAALNDFAAENPFSFKKTDCVVDPLKPFENRQNSSPGDWMIYHVDWVLAVGKLSAEHEERLRAVVDSASQELGISLDRDDTLSRLITKEEAAVFHSGSTSSNATAYFQKLIKAGKMNPPVGSGQRWRFYLNDFPESVRSKMV